MTDEEKQPEPRRPKPAPFESPRPDVVNVVMYESEQVAPDGHVNLSQEDIDNRA